MRISIFGLGYVGTVCAACLSSDGHQVIGVDVSPTKVDLVNRGLSPIIEADVFPRVTQAVGERRLWATSDSRAAVLESELTMICVGTPSQSNGSLDLSRVRGACEQIGAALSEKDAYHAVKVAFANEIGNISKASGVDGQSVMEIFCKDTKLNLSSYYLRPGFAFGGSCLPKDLRALTYKGRMLDLELPLLSSVLRSNQVQLEKGIRMVLDKGHRRVGVLGISFKAGTDDLRESPLVDLIEHLLGKGCELKVYDRNVRLAALMGANRDFIMNRIPHIAALLVPDMTQVLQFADTLVIGNGDPEFEEALANVRPDQTVVDLVRINGGYSGENYDGICW